MKYLLNLVLILALGVSIMSCSSTSTVRAVDVLTNVPAPIEVNSSIYKSGDIVWVDYMRMRVTTITSLRHNDGRYRQFVIQP